MIKITLSALLLAMSLSACAPSEQAKSVEYYQAHQDQIPAKIAECASKPGAVNCDSASAADAIIKQQKWLAQPPKRGVW